MTIKEREGVQKSAARYTNTVTGLKLPSSGENRNKRARPPSKKAIMTTVSSTEYPY
jgi:hypothetical protein